MKNQFLEQQNKIVIDENDLGTFYQEIGKGVEGTVYKYQENKVIKILHPKEVSLNTIIDRANFLMHIKVNHVTFPEDFVWNMKNEVIGYSMKFILPNQYKSFFNLYECQDHKEFIHYFILIQETIKELHRQDIFIGDFNPNNIMIDQENHPVFVDTINYATPKFDFLLESFNSMIFEKLFQKKCSLLDNDKFMFAFLLLSFFVSFRDLEKAVHNTEYFKEIIERFDISNASKDVLKNIFSNNEEKEYIDIVLRDLSEKNHPKYDNKFGQIIHMIFH